MNDFEAIDFFRSDAVVTDPYPYYEALRTQSPVQRENHHNVVMITGYDEGVEVLHDTDRFSSCISVTGPFPGFPVPLAGDDVTDLIAEHRDKLPFNDQLPTLDPPTHTDHRALLMRLITPKRLKENEAAMWQLAERPLGQLLEGGQGEYIGEFAGPFTLLVIADLLGVPESDREHFARTLGQPRDGHNIGGLSEAMSVNPLEFLYDQFSTYIRERRAQPREDVLTGLATATFPDGTVPEVLDAAKVAANLFSAGQETTVRLLSSALKVIAEQPEIQALLRAERHRISNFIEEVLRVESPVKGDFRMAKKTTTVGGVDIPAGSTLMIINGAANRDPRQFENPAVLDPARANARRHIAFGRGIHTCPGAPLARAETLVAIDMLLDRTTDIRVSEERHGPADNRTYRYMPTYILRGLTHLNLEFDLAEGGAR